MSSEIPVTEARAQFSDLVNRVGFGKERIILTRHGKPLVALVPAETLDGAPDETADAVPDSTVLDLSSTRSSQSGDSYTLAARDNSPTNESS